MQREKAKERGREKRVNVGQGDMRPKQTMQVRFLTRPKYLRPSACPLHMGEKSKAKEKNQKK